jgi:putative pyruvate formate lyase activating enzyme
MGPGIWVSLMNQYFPAHKGLRTPPLDRKVTPEEYEAAFRALMGLNLDNGFVQEQCVDDPIC